MSFGNQTWFGQLKLEEKRSSTPKRRTALTKLFVQNGFGQIIPSSGGNYTCSASLQGSCGADYRACYPRSYEIYYQRDYCAYQHIQGPSLQVSFYVACCRKHM